MNKTIKVIRFLIFTVAFIVVATLVPACSGPDKLPIEYGKFESGNYTNDYFGLTITVPDAWSVQHDLIDVEGSMLLLQCTESDGYFAIGSERISHQIHHTGRDLHEDTIRLMPEEEGVNVSFPTEIYVQTIDGSEFYVLEIVATTDDLYMEAKQYATIIGDYSLLIHLMWASEEGMQALYSILDTLYFN